MKKILSKIFKDFFHFWKNAFILIAIVFACIAIASVPVSFLGWLLMAFSNLLGAELLISYINAVVIGAVSMLIFILMVVLVS